MQTLSERNEVNFIKIVNFTIMVTLKKNNAQIFMEETNQLRLLVCRRSAYTLVSSFLIPIFKNGVIRSMGTGKMVVELFSAEISFNVCR